MTTMRSYTALLFSSTTMFFCFGGAGLAAQADRIRGPIDENDAVVLKGNVRAEALAANDAGPLDPTSPIRCVRLVLGQTAGQTADLERLLEEQRDPASADYRSWLSPEQFGERFGVSENDMAALTAWLESRGFAIEQAARSRTWISFTGSAEQMSAAFRTEFRRYEVNGEKHFANATNPSIPAAFAGVVTGLRGLDDFRPKPLRSASELHPEMNGADGAHYVAPADFAAIYDLEPLYEGAYDGSGQKLAIAGQTDIKLSDIRAFRSAFNLAAKDPQLVLAGTDPGVSANDQIEADLDLEWSGAVARNATIVYVYSQDVFESVEYAVDQNLAPVISVSYGGCESDSPALSYRTLAQQANAQGITWINASGDSGAAGCDPGATIATHAASVTFPADIPEVTALGGSELNEGSGSYWNSAGLALSYIPEKAWNDTPLGKGLAAGGGGASALFAKPWWQAGTGVPNDQARDVPDVALAASAAHDPYAIYANGQLMAVGGTSVASPSFAGIVTILNQYLVANKELTAPGLGNLNPSLYAMAQNVKGPFHDITSGNNVVPCAASVTGCVAGSYGYQAGAGYDLATGLGSVDADDLVTKWTIMAPATGTRLTLSASPAGIAETATTQLTATVSAVSGNTAPSGTVTFAAGSDSLGSAALTGSGTTASATFSIKGTALAMGANTITATYAATAAFSSSTATASVTVTQPIIATSVSLAANPASLASTGSTVLTAVVKPASGSAAPTGAVVFTSGKTQLGSVTVGSSTAGATATLTVKAASLTVGANAIVATYGGASGFSGSASPALTVTVAAPVIATSVALTANPVSFPQSSSTALTATVKPAAGAVLPTGTITFMAGNTALATESLSASVATGVAAATLILKGASLAIGNDAISAVYSGSGGFAGSTGTTTVTVTPPLTATTLALTAAPSTISPTASTVLTALVRPAGGAAGPTGMVTFATPGGTLGGGAVTLSSGAGTVTLTVKGAALANGANTVTASYTPTGNFAGSSASAVVTVQPVATTMTLTASPTSLASTGSTQLTATIKASGTVPPTGSVTFSVGKTTLGSAAVSGSGGTATLTLKGSSLAAGANSIGAVYAGAGFATATASATITVTPAAAVSKQAKRMF